ncbi:MAG: Rid family detoxifying hydrolase [Thermoplasmata archaeon]|nr:Rid family detoxifying hydrolase [Thermoplasmata archaeon]
MKKKDRKIVQTENAPAAIGPYSQAVSAGGFVFVSGQIALKPGRKKELVGDTAGRQTKQIMGNISVILEAAGTSLENAVKSTIYLTDIDDFTVVNRAYGSFFGDGPPARVTIEVSDLPLDALVMIDMIAV